MYIEYCLYLPRLQKVLGFCARIYYLYRFFIENPDHGRMYKSKSINAAVNVYTCIMQKLLQYSDVECLLPLLPTNLRKLYIYNGILPGFKLVHAHIYRQRKTKVDLSQGI